MGYARLALYMLGLIIVVAAAWIFLTQTPIADDIPVGVSLALVLLLVGVGVMAGARAMDDTFYSRRRVVREGDYAAPPATAARTTATYRDDVVPPASGETIVEERRY